MIDEGRLRERFPEIPWDQPVHVHVIGDRSPGKGYYGWACRYCIALHGLSAADIMHGRATEQVFPTREEGLDHIDRVHHD